MFAKRHILVRGAGGHFYGRLLPILRKYSNICAIDVLDREFRVDRKRSFVLRESRGDSLEDKTGSSLKFGLVASAPIAHLNDLCGLFDVGCSNVYVEKPVFSTKGEVDWFEQANAAHRRGINDCDMYARTKAFLYFRDWITEKWDRSVFGSMDVKFVIPRLKRSSYRDPADYFASEVVDVGFYPIDLMVRVALATGIKLDLLNVQKIGLVWFCQLRGVATDDSCLNFNVEFGFGDTYVNAVSINLSGMTSIMVDKIFSARAGIKEVILDGNSFFMEDVDGLDLVLCDFLSAKSQRWNSVGDRLRSTADLLEKIWAYKD